ncbi:MAG: hypothetical protein L0K90_01880 [Staphylococcus equorum]|nr:hypothetical protein [Staphylococcus equorum]MDN6629989.1 hypothetical protein [Staphylococcus equorum]
MAHKTTLASMTALKQYNHDYSKAWDFGTNWTNVAGDFETFINKYLFPKLNETTLQNVALGNRFEWLAKEIDFVSQYSEEYVILDTVPINMNLSKNEELMLKRNYPNMATKLYSQGVLKKTKFTLNNNDVRHNFLTLGDATKYALGVYKKRVSDINVSEEFEIKGTILDYALNHVQEVREVASRDELFTSVFEGILNIQNNSAKYNEANEASGGTIGRYTTVSDLKNIAILTNDSMKTYLLDTKLANTYQVEGLDLSDRIISFDDLGGLWKTTGDVTIEEQDTVDLFRSMGDYQIKIDDLIPEGSVFTFDVTTATEFAETLEEVKPTSDLFAYVFDINKLRYRRNTKDMLKQPFYNGEFDEITYWLHYYSFKSMSPFFNSILVTGTGA